jgi:hypothetical protein
MMSGAHGRDKRPRPQRRAPDVSTTTSESDDGKGGNADVNHFFLRHQTNAQTFQDDDEHISTGAASSDSSSDSISILDKDDVLDPKSIAKRSVEATSSRSPTCFVSSVTSCASWLLDCSCSDEENNLSSNDRVSKKRKKKEVVADQALAEQLQRIEADAATKKAMKRKSRRELEERGKMLNSSDGKAVLAVQEIVALVQSAKDTYINGNSALQQLCVETVAMDDMVFMAKNMLDKQKDFTQGGVSGHIGKLHDW